MHYEYATSNFAEIDITLEDILNSAKSVIYGTRCKWRN